MNSWLRDAEKLNQLVIKLAKKRLEKLKEISGNDNISVAKKVMF